MLIKYAIDRDWGIYSIYSDDDYTGADRNRPAFNRLLEDAKARKFDIILCKSQSRFTRELEMVERYIHGLFPLWGIRFIGVVDNADTSVKGNKKARQINALINEWYLEDLSDNIRSVFTAKKENGAHIGSFALYGYKKDPDQKGHLIIDEEAAQVVREVFQLFTQGYGKTAIARTLNERNIPNPSEYKRRQGLRYKQPNSRNSALWRYFTIADMLTNEMYTGTMVQGKYKSISFKTQINKPVPKKDWVKVPHTHEAIIEPELWERAQDLIARRMKPFSDTGQIGLFSKKVKCMHCGYTMLSSKAHERRYLKCGTRHVAKSACIGSFIPVLKLEEIVLHELRNFEKYLYVDKLTREHVDALIDCIYVGKKDAETGELPVEIHWNF